MELTEWIRFTSKAGKSFDAHLKLDDDFKTAFEFPQKSAGAKGKPK